LVLDFLSEDNILKILGAVYLRYSGESRFYRDRFEKQGERSRAETSGWSERNQ
jgi:threonine/homoserine/homoserine lactone efflux protein